MPKNLLGNLQPHDLESLANPRGTARAVETNWRGYGDGERIRRFRRRATPLHSADTSATGEPSPFARAVEYVLAVDAVNGTGDLYVVYLKFQLALSRAHRAGVLAHPDNHDSVALMLVRLCGRAAAAFLAPCSRKAKETALMLAAGSINRALAFVGQDSVVRIEGVSGLQRAG